LEGISQIDYEWMVDLMAKLKGEAGRKAKRADLLEQTPFLNDIGNGLHANAFCLVDVFEGV
jgi:hypothetical protein